MAYKTEFELIDEMESGRGAIDIIEPYAYFYPQLRITVKPTEKEMYLFLRDEDLEELAVNILRALKSDKLK
jgi:hypothetical protein